MNEGNELYKIVQAQLYRDIVESLTDIMEMIQTAQLVRSTAADHAPDWAIRNLDFVRKLGHAHQTLVKVKGIESGSVQP